MLILAHPLVDLVLRHGAESGASADVLGSTLAMFSLGLPGFCIYLYMTRVLQSMQDTRTAFLLYLAENGTNIVLGLALVGPLGVRGLALSFSIAYTVSAGLALGVVARKVGGLGGRELSRPVKRVVGATLVMALVAVLAVNTSSAISGVGLLARVGLALVGGTVAYGGTAAVLGERSSRRESRRRSAISPTPPPDGQVVTSGPAFRGRIEGQPDFRQFRHLRPVEARAEDDEGNDVHGPGTGGNR
jgi:putative peptidoglycan lipid II flippase